MKQITKEIKEKDLVLLRLPNNPELEGRQRHYNVWVRVLLVDTDGTFYGDIEKADSDYTRNQIGFTSNWPIEKVQRIYLEGEQFCYSDNVTVCNCKGLCENK